MQGDKLKVRLIILFHVAGLIGLAIPFLKPIFLDFVPFHLWLMLYLVLSAHNKAGFYFLLFSITVFIAGFAAEWIGVHTAWPFGDYHYGRTLGFKVSKIPVVMGANWLSLIYSTGVLIQYSPIKSKSINIMLGAAVLVLLDLLIEPVAMRLDYWHWANKRVPLNNYICWFIFGGLLLFWFDKFKFKKQSIVSLTLLLAQFIFFGAYNLFMIFRI